MQNAELQQLQPLQQLQQLQRPQQSHQNGRVAPVSSSFHEMMPISPALPPSLPTMHHASASQAIPIPDPMGPSEILAASRKYRSNSGPFEWLASKSAQHSSNLSQVGGNRRALQTAPSSCCAFSYTMNSIIC